ncbi:MAG TPA: DUF1801 domain-containing protein [Gemmatimonadaceae bacterium]|nr:DUF1801 domain-containing protein [Gemmatimonadaceae bacterium]
MATSAARTVLQYLASLPPERRRVVVAVRGLIRKHLPAGYREMMGWGVITWAIPLSHYPKTYNGQPLCYAALAAQKNGYSLYLMGIYGDRALNQWFRDEFRKAGKKLDMGKSCVRFKTVDDLALPAVAGVIGEWPAAEWIKLYESSRARTARRAR